MNQVCLKDGWLGELSTGSVSRMVGWGSCDQGLTQGWLAREVVSRVCLKDSWLGSCESGLSQG